MRNLDATFSQLLEARERANPDESWFFVDTGDDNCDFYEKGGETVDVDELHQHQLEVLDIENKLYGHWERNIPTVYISGNSHKYKVIDEFEGGNILEVPVGERVIPGRNQTFNDWLDENLKRVKQ